MSRAASHRSPKICGKLSRKLSRTRWWVSASLHSGLSIARIRKFSASWIVAQLSTSVLSQSNRIARGRRMLAAASGGRGGMREIEIAQLLAERAGSAVGHGIAVDRDHRQQVGGRARQKRLASEFGFGDRKRPLLE